MGVEEGGKIVTTESLVKDAQRGFLDGRLTVSDIFQRLYYLERSAINPRDEAALTAIAELRKILENNR